MQRGIFRLAILLSLVLAGALSAQAQYLVSTKAGFINRVEGKASIRQLDAGLETTSKASLGAQLKEGDQFFTEADARAEVLLSPGSYLRMSERTEITAVRTDLENSRFDVVKGSVIIEVGEVDKKSPVEIGTPRTVVTIAKAGIYRIDVSGSDVSVGVRRGEAYLGTKDQLVSKTAVKVGGNRAYQFLGGNPPATVKLSEKVFDSFDEWSYLRAESLMGANYSVLTRMRSRDALMSGWIYDPLSNGYTFIPSSWLFLTPYGFGVYRRFVDCDICWMYPSYGRVYYSPGVVGGISPNTNRGGVSNASVGDRAGSRQTSRSEGGSRRVEPYTRASMDTYTRSRSSSMSGMGDGSYTSSRGGGMSAGAGSSMPAASSAPVGGRGDGGSANTSRGSSSRGN